MPAYEYKPLSPGKHIRIVRLHPSPKLDAPLDCSIREISLDSNKSTYEAVSYAWGSPIRDKEVTCDGRTLLVTRNCFTAMQYLRRKFKTRALWIDAICIDQSSVSERNHQVELMGTVYKRARRALIWLGEGDDDTKKLMRHLHWFGTYLRIEDKCSIQVPFTRRAIGGELAADIENPPPSLEKLLQHEWFHRTWTLQELVLARNATIVCGHHSTSWDSYLACILHGKWSAGDDRPAYVSHSIRFVYQLWTKPHKSRQILPHVLKRNAHDSSEFWNQPDMSLIRWNLGGSLLIACVRQRLASNPRDKVYGLYSMLIDLGFHLPEPDYNQPVAQIYEDFTFSVIVRSQSLYIIYTFSDALVTPGWPSWVPNLEKLSERFDTGGLDEESLWKVFREDFQPKHRPGELVLEGIIFGNLKTIGVKMMQIWDASLYEQFDLATTQMMTILWLEQILEMAEQLGLCANGEQASTAILTGLFKLALVAPNDGFEQRMRNGIALALEAYAISQDLEKRATFASTHHNPQLQELTPESMLDYLFKQPGIRWFLEVAWRLCRYCAGRTPIITSNGWIGLATGDVDSSDLVALIHGCAVPMIVRAAGGSFTLVGPAFMGGIQENAWPLRGDEEGILAITLV